MRRLKKGQRKRALIHTENEAIKWYAKKMGLEDWTLPLGDRQGHFTYGTNQRDSLIWLHGDAGTSTIVHEVSHAMVRLADILETSVGEQTDEVFAYYSGWLAGEIVHKLYQR